MKSLQRLKNRLATLEKELDTCRTSVLQDGWQTQRFARKSRKWDILAVEKMKLIQLIDEQENNIDSETKAGFLGEN